MTRPATIGRRALRACLAALLLPALLGGCSLLGGGDRTPPTFYAPEPAAHADPSWPTVDWQLALATPDAARIVDSLRINVRPTPGELQVYKGANWVRPPSDQLEDTVLHLLEDSGRIRGVARQESGIAANYKLVMELRRYEADYGGDALPKATIEVSAKLMRTIDQQVVASRTFLQAAPAGSTDVATVAQAFGQALGAIGTQIAGWTLESGAADAASRPPPAIPAATGSAGT